MSRTIEWNHYKANADTLIGNSKLTHWWSMESIGRAKHFLLSASLLVWSLALSRLQSNVEPADR